MVDDEVPLLRLITRVLEKAGHQVLTAENGEQAMEVFAENQDRIDGVILDVVMPPRGISPVMREMTAARSDLALVLASGDVPPPEIEEEMEAHGGLFLRKPFVPKALLRILDDAFANQGRRPAEGKSR